MSPLGNVVVNENGSLRLMSLANGVGGQVPNSQAPFTSTPTESARAGETTHTEIASGLGVTSPVKFVDDFSYAIKFPLAQDSTKPGKQVVVLS